MSPSARQFLAASKAPSKSAEFFAASTAFVCTPSDLPPVPARRSWSALIAGSSRTATRDVHPTRLILGATSLRSPSHLPPMLASKLVKPVMFPPGFAKFVTAPSAIASMTSTKTIGMVRVSCFWRNGMVGAETAEESHLAQWQSVPGHRCACGQHHRLPNDIPGVGCAPQSIPADLAAGRTPRETAATMGRRAFRPVEDQSFSCSLGPKVREGTKQCRRAQR